MKAALLPDRGVVKVVGDTARTFLNGLLTSDVDKVAPGHAAYAALLTPQGKIIVDGIVAEAPAEDGGGFFIDVPRALAGTLTDRLNFYKLRAKVMVEDLSETLGVLAAWEGDGDSEYGLVYRDPRVPALGLRMMLPPHLKAEAAADLGAQLVSEQDYDAHRIALGVPRGGFDFTYSDAFPHEADMDQLGGVDFKKGCYVGQEIVSRMEHRGTARTRVIPADYHGAMPATGVTIEAGGKEIGMFGSAANGKGLALLRIDRAAEALAAGHPLLAGGVPISLRKPEWAHFAMPGETKAAS